MTMMMTGMMTGAQASYLANLLDQRECAEVHAEALRARIARGEVTKQQASDAIGWLKTQPFKAVVAAPNLTPVTEAGIYETPDGKIYQVKWNKTKTNLYAKVLDMTVTEAIRLTAAGTKIKATYVYEAGAIHKIDAAWKITGPRAEELSIVFTSCIVCGRTLKQADSVKAGIGPVCRKKV
jgi:hypothetical protein